MHLIGIVSAIVGVGLVGLTSPRNVEFVESTGYYDRVVAYPDIDQLDQEAREPIAAETKAEDEDIEKEVAGRAEAALQAVIDTTRTFKFRSLGRTTYRALIAAHPPTDADHTAARVESGDMNARASWNRETFFPALVHAASVGPQLTETEVAEIFESPDWSDGEVDLLVQGAIKAQISTSQIA